jgi:hypothetical protein
VTEDNAALTATIKAGAGYDAPWIVVRADNPQQLAERLNAVANLTGPLVAAAQVLQGEWSGQQGGGQANPGNQGFGGNQGGGNGGFSGQGNGGYNGNQNQGGGGGQQGGGGGTPEPPGRPNCAHGEMLWKTGKRKLDSKAYAMWTCQSRDRNNQCKPEFPPR